MFLKRVNIDVVPGYPLSIADSAGEKRQSSVFLSIFPVKISRNNELPVSVLEEVLKKR
ncbi:hypothetical protein [Butyricimonas paravirosa]